MFIQADQYISSCTHTCKSLYPNSVGITESMKQQYSSGPGRYKQKCWCEFGRGKLDSTNHGYRTCILKEFSKLEVSSPSNVSSTAEDSAPKYIMVVTSCSPVPVETKDPYFKGYQVLFTKCKADEVQGQKMGRYTLQPESYNNFPVWKKEHLHPEQYLFMSDNHHWVIGPDITSNLFGLLSDDSPAPVFPHLAETWRFWDGHYWKEGNITVMAGEKKDVDDVQGPLGEGHGFVTDNLEYVGHLFLDKIGAPLHPSSCCNECRKRYNDTEMFTYRGNTYDFETNTLVPKESFVECTCMKVGKEGTRPVTRRMGEEYHTGICEDIGPPVDCEIKPYWWDDWTECTNLRKTCGRGFRSRYAYKYKMARRGGKPCEEMEQVQSCEVEHCPPA